jgi:hypothetical protein
VLIGETYLGDMPKLRGGLAKRAPVQFGYPSDDLQTDAEAVGAIGRAGLSSHAAWMSILDPNHIPPCIHTNAGAGRRVAHGVFDKITQGILQ